MGCLKSKEKIGEVGIVRTTKVRFSKDEDDSKVLNGKYTIMKTIGKGSFGKVKLVVGEKSKAFAMKILNKKNLKKKRNPNGTTAYDDVLNEVKIMERLVHKNVVRIYEVIDDEDHDFLYIILEFCPKGKVMSIRHILPRSSEEKEKRRHSDRDSSEILKEECDFVQLFCFFSDGLDGLEYLHSKNIFHGDIKPENLLVCEDETVKISDFGVSLTLESGDQPIRRSSGTPSFQAPEVFQDQPFLPFKVDLWALAVSYYVMVYRQMPFEGSSYTELGTSIRQSMITFPKEKEIHRNNRIVMIHFPNEHIQKLFEQFIGEMLEKNPQKRLSDVEGIRKHPFFMEMEKQKKKRKRKSILK